MATFIISEPSWIIGNRTESKLQIRIGADPEVFVFDKSINQFICGEGLIPGTKHNPHIVDKGAIQVDGTALEFNIDPAETLVQFAGNVAQVFGILKERVAHINPNYELRASPVADFDVEAFKGFSVSAKQLGCEPDYNAYTREPNEPPVGERPFRTGSGHIHVGWTEDKRKHDGDHFDVCCEVAQVLDRFLFIASKLWDKDDRRRELYGKPGAFRPKSYGMEYRVLSNAWLKHPKLIEWVYLATRAAINNYQQGRIYLSRGHLQTLIREMQTDRIIVNYLRDWGFPPVPEEVRK